MPTYEFACPAGHQFTRFYRKMSEAVAELPCPECGQPSARKISGGAGLLFKGSGFYITDYGKDGKKGAAAATAGESTSGAAKSGESRQRESNSSSNAGSSSSPAPASKPAGTASTSERSSSSSKTKPSAE